MDIREKTRQALSKKMVERKDVCTSLNDPSILIDCSSFLYQIVFRELSKRKSAPAPSVNTIVMQFLCATLSLPYDFNSDYRHIEYFWDSRHSKRKEEYPEYKGHRKVSDDPRVIEALGNMRIAIKRLRKIFKKTGFSSHRMRGYEADDLIAYRARGLFGSSVIASSDSDMWQLMNPNIMCYSPMKQTLYTDKDFQNEYKFPASKWSHVLAISGCTTDNVKGIKGFAKKSALTIVQGTHAIMKNMDPPASYERLMKKMRSIAGFSTTTQRNKRLTTLPFPDIYSKEGLLEAVKRVKYTDPSLTALIEAVPSLLEAEELHEALRSEMNRWNQARKVRYEETTIE